MIIRKCSCGSGHEAIAQFDGYGIFMCYICKTCRKERMQRFRRDIMERYDTNEPIEEE